MSLRAATWLLALCLAATLHAPTLTGGFKGDDYVQYGMLHGTFPSPRAPWDLFSFAAGTPEDFAHSSDFGYLPWWSHPALRLRMFRPLASALMALDFTLFGTHAAPQHAHTWLWFGLLLWAAGRVCWRFLPPRAAVLTLLLFAAAPCHTLPLSWLANRSTLLGSAFAFLALDLQASARLASTHVRARKWAAAFATLLALAAGEYGLCALVYALVYAFTGDQPWNARTRCAAAWPVLLPALCYVALHSLIGSDIVHSGFYISPTGSPKAFAMAALTRVPVLCADLLLGLPSLHYSQGSPLRTWLLSSGIVPVSLWPQLPDWQTWHVLLGYAAISCGLWYAVTLRRSAPAPSWLFAAAGLSLIPVAGSLPEDRLLVAASLGSCALLACILTRDLRTHAPRLVAYALWCCAAWAAGSGLVRSYQDARTTRTRTEMARAFAVQAEFPPHPESTRVYLLAAADFNTAANLPWLRQLELGEALPRSYRRLSPGPLPLDVTRTADRALEVSVLTSGIYGTALPSLYRSAAAPVRSGERHELPGLAVTVLTVFANNPTRIRFEFDRSLDDPALWFLVSTVHGLKHHVLPAVGATERLPFAQYGDVRQNAPH